MLSDAAAPLRQKTQLIVRVVAFCAAHAWIVVTAVILLCVAMTRYVGAHFALTTDTNALLSPNLPWRVRQAEFNSVFPPESSDVVVVVDGQTP